MPYPFFFFFSWNSLPLTSITTQSCRVPLGCFSSPRPSSVWSHQDSKPLLNPFPHAVLWFDFNTWTYKFVLQLRSSTGLRTYICSCLQVQLHVNAVGLSNSTGLTWLCASLSMSPVPAAETSSLFTQARNPGIILTSSHKILAILPSKELSNVLKCSQCPLLSPQSC